MIQKLESDLAKTKTGTDKDNVVKLNLEKTIFENFEWLRTDETAEYLRTSPKQIRKWVYQGRLKAYKLLGKSLRFRRSELDLLLQGGQSWE